ncbi:TrbG/VirB9 family P-type conjugative transfer protein [Rubrivirga sp. S365]|uniref:TrbG/VirB9 family P-type conjugative transfer protein n=1 Tax=Rubrivirga sp. S365 TaxID=3076080 RepID=UPI0028D5FE14|nr:TrbG/VirB9 family P-type conjugative transfer protein [Rubrivirga sp. S365]
MSAASASAQSPPEAIPDVQTVVDLSPAPASGVAERAVGRPVGDGFDGGAVVVTAGEMEEALGELVREYQRTGRAGVLRQSAVWVFPFGHTQPVLACAPLRASVVELEEDETVLGVVAGDTERFAIDLTTTGPGGRTPLVVVKPLAYDVTTNVVVSTDRRVYHVTLDSAPRPSGGGDLNPQSRYARHVRFYYPDDALAALAAAESGAPIPTALLTTGSASGDGVSLDDLSFGYEWSGSPELRERLERVFDDGVHTYLQLSADPSGEAPVLYVIGPDGSREIVNYAYRPGRAGAGTYVADRVLNRADLVIGATVKKGPFGLFGRRQVERFVRIARVSR